MIFDIDKKKYDLTAVMDNHGEEMTYGDLTAFISKISEVIPYRCLMFILCRNRVAAAAMYLAALSNRIVPLMLGADMDAELLEDLYKRYRPSFVWKPDDLLEAAEETVYRQAGFSLVRYDTCEYPLYEDLALLLSTSGSTGSPKLVRHSYKNLRANARNISLLFDLTSSDRAMIDLPIQYTYGLSVLNSHIYSGAVSLLSDVGVMHREYWDFFRENRATSITGVPYTYEMMKKFRLLSMDLPSLELLSQGGGGLDKELQSEYAACARESGRRFIITYGQTEGTARMAYLPADKAEEKPGSIGKAIPNGRIYLVDEDGKIIKEPHVRGEMVYEGENVTLGYAETFEDLKRGDERKGVLPTGDMAEQDEEGYLYIAGRKKRFLKMFGSRVGLDECERLIAREFATECACTGIDNMMNIYVTKAGIEGEVNAFISRKLRINISAFRTARINALPRNEAGKVLYEHLADM